MKKIFLLSFLFLVIVQNGIKAKGDNQIIFKSVQIYDKEDTAERFLTIYNDESIRFKFISATNNYNKYTVFLNGKEVAAKKDSIEFSNLKTGKYYLVVYGISKEGLLTKPSAINFMVKDKSFSSFGNTSLIVVFAIVSVLLLLIIFYLLSKLKSASKALPNTKKLNTVLRENEKLKGENKKLKSEMNNFKSKNSSLKSNIDLLNQQISSLEKANISLAEQKERLVEQKIKLEDLQKQKDKLYAIAVHDIKNPAATIKGLLELLGSYDLNATDQQEIMMSLVNSSENILKLTQQISQTIASQKEEEVLQKEKASIQEIIESVVSVNSRVAQRKGIKIVSKSSPSLPECEFDKSKMEEVIDNLVNNAIKYAPSDTTVIVRSYFSPEAVSVEVEDNGIGLTPEDQKKAFQKGVTLTPKPTGGESSSGLGLWIVKSIIEEHNGKVWVNSKVGIGSKFGFDLPRE